jgi:hypothetical protein
MVRDLKIKLAQATQEKVEVLMRMAAGGGGGGQQEQEEAPRPPGSAERPRGLPIPGRSPGKGGPGASGASNGSSHGGGSLAGDAGDAVPGSPSSSAGGAGGAWSEEGEAAAQQGQFSHQQMLERLRNIERLVTVAARFRAQLAGAAAALQAASASSPAKAGSTPTKGSNGSGAGLQAVAKVLEECRAYRQQVGILPEEAGAAAEAGGVSLSSSLGRLGSLLSPGSKAAAAAAPAAASRRVDRAIAGEVLELVELAGRALRLQQAPAAAC